MELTKTIKRIKDEILDLKQGGKVMSTMTSYYFQTVITIPADPSVPSGSTRGFETYRLLVKYKSVTQPVFSRIPVDYLDSSANVGSEAWRSPVENGQQYVWIWAPVKGDPQTLTFRIISTAEVDSATLVPE